MPTSRRYPSSLLGWVLVFHSMLGPAMEGQLEGDAPQQTREWRKKARCPLSSSRQGYMRHLCLYFMMPTLISWQELDLAKHKARRTGASRRMCEQGTSLLVPQSAVSHQSWLVPDFLVTILLVKCSWLWKSQHRSHGMLIPPHRSE